MRIGSKIDGDIRRALIRKALLDVPIETITFTEFIYLDEGAIEEGQSLSCAEKCFIKSQC